MKKLGLTIMLAAMVLCTPGCSGTQKNQSIQTTAASENSSEAKESKASESEEETKESVTTTPAVDIPDGAEMMSFINPKMQIQLSFYLTNIGSDWDRECTSKKDPVQSEQAYKYSTKVADDRTFSASLTVQAVTPESVKEWIENCDDQVTIGDHSAGFDDSSTGRRYIINLGKYSDDLELCSFVNIGGFEGFDKVDGYEEFRDVLLETLTATTEYEGKEDMGDRLYLSTATCSLPPSIDINGTACNITQTAGFGGYSLKARLTLENPQPVVLSAKISLPVGSNYMTDLADQGYTETELGGYPAYVKQTEYVYYVRNDVRFTVGSVNYEAYTYTYLKSYYDFEVDVNNTSLQQTAEELDAMNDAKDIMKADLPAYYQLSLDLLNEMISQAEFVEPDTAWYE